MSKPLEPDDPCYWMLNNTKKATRPVIFKQGCYICEDPEFAMMGLPLCRRCPECNGHIAADNTVCDDCGFEEIY